MTMEIRDAIRGTGRLTEDAAMKAALEAAKRAAEAARKAAAEAAARKAAAEAAKKASTAELTRGTGRLDAGKNADFGDLPWEKGVHTAAVATAAVGAVTGSVAYRAIKDSLSVKKKVEDIQKTVNQVNQAVSAVKNGGGTFQEVLSQLNTKKPPSVKPLDTLGKVNGVIRVTGGIQSAINLKKDLESFKDGVSLTEATSAAGNALNVLRGAEEGSKLLRGGAGFLGKMAPGIGIAASSVDAVKRVEKLTHWNDLDTKDKVANVAYLLGDAADIAGNFFPPAKAIGAGLALVGMAAENWDSVKAGASKVADVTAKVASAAVDTAKEAVHEVAESAKKAVSDIAGGVKKMFSGL